jgi:hypothetical protein
MKIQLESGEQRTVDGEVIAIGSGAHCGIRFANDPRVQAEHATLRKLGNRWLAEAHGEAMIQAGTASPSRMVWLQPGDMLRLAAEGPMLLFEPADTGEDFAGKAEAGRRAWADALVASPAGAVASQPVVERPSRFGRSVAAPPPASPSATPSAATEPCSSEQAAAPKVVSREPVPQVWRTLAKNPVAWVALAAIVSAVVVLAQLGQGSGVAAPSSKQGPPPAPPPDLPAIPAINEGLVQANEAVAVWIALESPDKDILPVGSGWAIGPRTVITTAKLVRMLEEFGLEGYAVLVYGTTRRERAFIKGSALKIHSDYDRDRPTSFASQHFNLGAIALEEPLVEHGQAALSKDVEAVREDWPLMLAGFQIPKLSLEKLSVYNRLNSPLLTRVEGRVVRMATLPGKPGLLPRLELDWAPPEGTEGCPVFNAAGKVVGILSRESGPVSVVLWEDSVGEALKIDANP